MSCHRGVGIEWPFGVEAAPLAAQEPITGYRKASAAVPTGPAGL